MALPWYRYYAEDMEIDQVVDLSDIDFRTWVALQHIGSQEELRGRLPDTRKVARRLVALGVRVSEARAAQQLALFRERGLLVEDPDGSGRLVAWNWKARQKISDDGATRMKEFRRTRSPHVLNNDRTSSERVTVFPSSSSSGAGSVLPGSEYLPGITEEEEEGGSAHVQHMLRAAGIARPKALEIERALEESGAECVEHCIEIACRNNKLSWAYVEATRKGHGRDGCPFDITETRRERLLSSQGRD